MKRLLSILAIVGTVVWFSAPVFAATATAGPFTTSASVDGSLSLTATLHKNSSTGATVSSMDFGQLTSTATGNTLRSDASSTTGTGNVTAMLTANSHGLPYTISETGTAMSNGSATLPAGACTFVPVYASQDNGGAALPTGASVGAASSWVSATAKPIYTSESGTAAMRTVQAIYSITDDPSAGANGAVPLNQPGGTYSGTVTFTVTA